VTDYSFDRFACKEDERSVPLRSILISNLEFFILSHAPLD